MTVFTTVTLLRKQLPANATSPQRHLWQPYAPETLRDSSRLRGGLGPALTTKTRRRKEWPSFWLRLAARRWRRGGILLAHYPFEAGNCAPRL